jgi:hypothetical protein
MFVIVTTVTCTASVPRVASGLVIPAIHFSALLPCVQLQHIESDYRNVTRT